MAKFRTQTYVIGRMDGSIETSEVSATNPWRLPW